MVLVTTEAVIKALIEMLAKKTMIFEVDQILEADTIIKVVLKEAELCKMGRNVNFFYNMNILHRIAFTGLITIFQVIV